MTFSRFIAYYKNQNQASTKRETIEPVLLILR
jgi:hypothetical protein